MFADITVRPVPVLVPLGRAFMANRVLIAIVALHLGVALFLSQATGVPFSSGTTDILLTAFKVLIPTFVIALFLLRFIWMAVVVRPAKPSRWFINDIKGIAFDPERLAFGIIAFSSVSIMCGTFSYLKDMIPLLNPFAWDTSFAEWDRVLHGGIDPWRLLAPVFGSAAATMVLNIAYNLWFFLLYFSVFYACFDIRHRARSMTYLIAFVLCWIVGGNILATLMSSVGPAFYADFGYGNLFEPQMEMLSDFAKTHPIWALDTQVMLLDNYHSDGPVRGISAMPSMHVTMAVAFALYAFTIRRWLGWIMAGYAAMIMIGSVHLAWHYAIDGYLGAVIAVAAWWVARALTRRFAV